MEANCTECSKVIEYDADQANSLINCPHCGAMTGLPRLANPPANRKSKLLILVAVVAVPMLASAVVFLKLAIPGELQQGFGALALFVVAALMAWLAISWLLLPVIVWTKLDALIAEQRKQTALLRHPPATRLPNP